MMTSVLWQLTVPVWWTLILSGTSAQENCVYMYTEQPPASPGCSLDGEQRTQIQLKCKVAGPHNPHDPRLGIRWFRNSVQFSGQLQNTSGTFTLTSLSEGNNITSTLTVQNWERNRGSYYCQLSISGSTSQTIPSVALDLEQLNSPGVPDCPSTTFFQTEPSCASVSITRLPSPSVTATPMLLITSTTQTLVISHPSLYTSPLPTPSPTVTTVDVTSVSTSSDTNRPPTPSTSDLFTDSSTDTGPSGTTTPLQVWLYVVVAVAAVFAMIIIILVIMCVGQCLRKSKTGVLETPKFQRSQIIHNPHMKDVPKEMMVSSNSIRLLHSVGEGEFGIVYKGHFVKSIQLMPDIVAVKTLKGFFDQNRVVDMIKESVKMHSFEHPHVLNIIGVCVDAGPSPYIVMPFMANGSLLTYIRKEKKNLVIPTDSTDDDLATVARKRLADMCLQIAKGMKYLASKKIVHRDLAARNCMIDTNFIIKVSDFGLSESIYSETYFRQAKSQAVKLPVKWLAPEALTEGVFSEMSDVWSYGVTCWELFTGGKNPYPGVDPITLPNLLESGHRLDKPNNAACSEEMYLFMFNCWHADPYKRPTFTELVSLLSQTLSRLAGYMDVFTFAELIVHNGDGENETVV